MDTLNIWCKTKGCEMTYIVSGGALNLYTHSLCDSYFRQLLRQ